MDLNFETTNLFAGSDWSFSELLSDYPSSEYNLDIIIKKGSGSAHTLEGTADGDDGFDFSEDAATTALFGYGLFSFQAVFTKISDGTIPHVEAGEKNISPLLTASGDTRTYWEVIRDEAKECYTKLSQMIVTETNFKGKVLKYEDRGKILEMIHIAELEIEKEKAEQSGELSKQKTYRAILK